MPQRRAPIVQSRYHRHRSEERDNALSRKGEREPRRRLPRRNEELQRRVSAQLSSAHPGEWHDGRGGAGKGKAHGIDEGA